MSPYCTRSYNGDTAGTGKGQAPHLCGVHGARPEEGDFALSQ